MKNLTLALVATLALAGCVKQDSNSGGVSSPGLPGVWNTSGVNDSDSVDHIETLDTDFGFMEISNAGDVTYHLSGIFTNDDSKPGPKILRFGKLRPSGPKKAEIIISQEMIAWARENGISQAEIDKAMSNPCTIELIGENELEQSCPSSETENKTGERNVNKMRRAGPTELSEKIAGLKAAEKAKPARVSELARSLGGRKFRFAGADNTWTSKDGKESSYHEKAEGREDETGTGESKSIRANLIEFSGDLKTARVNGKHEAEVRLKLLKDLSGVKMEVLIKKGKNSYSLPVWGKIERTEKGIRFVTDSSYKGTRYSTKSNYELVP